MSRTRGGPGLLDRTVSASGWRFVTVAVQVVLQLVVLSVLSRLIPPEEFGLLGIAMIFVGLAALVSDLGTGAALIQRAELTERHIRVAFTVSLAIGVLLAAGLGLGAPLWAALFRSEEVAPVLRLMSLSFILTSVGLVPNALLWRGMQMRAVGLAEIASYVAGYGLTGILLAFSGYGVWSLAWAVMVQSAVRTALLVWLAPFRCVPGFWREEAGQILGYGTGLSLTRLLNFAATKGDYVVVGRWLGAEALGLYERAYRLMEMPANYFAGVVGRVMFPALSEIQDETARLRRAFTASLVLTVSVYAPAAALLWVAAPTLVLVLFGAPWLGAVRPLQILSAGLVFRGAYKVCDSLIRSKGAVYRSAWRVLFYAVAVFVGAWLGKASGVGGVAVGVTCAITLKYLVVAQLCGQLIGLGLRDWVRIHLPGIVLGSLVGGSAWGVDRLLETAGVVGWLRLVSLGLVAVLVIPLGVLLIPRSWVGAELQMLTDWIERRVPRLAPIVRWLGPPRDSEVERNARDA